MNLLSKLISSNGLYTDVYYDFSSGLEKMVKNKQVDAYLVATEDGFSPLGSAKTFLANELGWNECDIRNLADWNRFNNDKVTLIACQSRNPKSFLRGFILCPCENSKCYTEFAQPLYGKPYRDFYYNITYEAIAFATQVWNAKKLAISHLSAGGNYHQDIALCTAEALGHFCDKTQKFDSFSFIDCCISPEDLKAIERLNPDGCLTSHRAISVNIQEQEKGVVFIDISWDGKGDEARMFNAKKLLFSNNYENFIFN